MLGLVSYFCHTHEDGTLMRGEKCLLARWRGKHFDIPFDNVAKDSFVWHHTKHGGFIVRSAYHLIMKHGLSNPVAVKRNHQPVMGDLVIHVNPHARKIRDDYKCPIWKAETQSVIHVIHDCTSAKETFGISCIMEVLDCAGAYGQLWFLNIWASYVGRDFNVVLEIME